MHDRAPGRTLTTDVLPLTKTQISEAEGVNPRTVKHWITQGLPHNKMTGGRGLLSFCPDAVRRWRQETGHLGSSSAVAQGTTVPEGPDGEQTRADIRTLNLEIKRLDAAKRQRIEDTANALLFSRGETEAKWLERVQLVGAGLMALGARVAPLCAGKSAQDVAKVIETAARELLTEFARDWPS